MNTIEQVIQGCATLTAGATLTITGLVSSDGSVKDICVKFLPLDGYKKMQQKDMITINDALAQDDLSEGEVAAAHEMLKSLEKALTPKDTPESFSGPQYQQDTQTPVHRLASSPDAIYFLRLERQGDGDVSKSPPKGPLPLAKFLLTRKLRLCTAKYVHAVKLEEGKFTKVVVG